MYRVFNWYIKDITYYKTLPYTKDGEVVSYLDTSCGCIQGEEGMSPNSDSYFYNSTEVYQQETLYTRIAVDTNNPVQLILDNGTYRFTANITNTSVSFGSYTYSLNAKVFHDYIISTNGTSALLFVDNVLVGSIEDGSSSSEAGCYLKFQNPLNDLSALYIKNLGTVQGFKLPLDLDSLQFELQVDSVDTFNSINLKTYTNGLGDNKHSLICAQTSEVIEGGAFGDKLGRSFTIQIPPRQLDKPYFFYYRVRPIYSELGTGEIKYGDWAYFMFDEPDNIFLFDTTKSMEEVSNMEEGIIAFCEENRQSYYFKKGVPPVEVLLPSVSTESDTGNNVVINISESVILDQNDNIVINTPLEVVENISNDYIKCSLSDGYWKPTNNSYFMLDTNVSETIFNSVNNRLPSDEVYTRYNKSGNIANIISVEAQLEDKVRYQLLETIRDSRLQSAREIALPTIYGTKYNLDPAYFEDNLMYRYALMDIDKYYRVPGAYKGIVDIFTTITGVKPIITEYKDVPGWVIYSESDMLDMETEEIYHLDDEETLYPEYKTAVLYSDEERAFTFDIEIFNPYNVKLTESMVKEIVTAYKPVATLGNIIMHHSNGREFQYPGYYYFGHYGNDLYYPKSEEYK